MSHTVNIVPGYVPPIVLMRRATICFELAARLAVDLGPDHSGVTYHQSRGCDYYRAAVDQHEQMTRM